MKKTTGKKAAKEMRGMERSAKTAKGGAVKLDNSKIMKKGKDK
jgi:hypothetical protein